MKAFRARLAGIWRSQTARYGVILILCAGLFALALTWRPAIAPIAVPSPGSFPPEQVARGAVLAKLGDCAVCHTADSGRPLAGGQVG